MHSKYKNNKTICPENREIEKSAVSLPAAIVAEVAEVSESLVKKVRSGIKGYDTPAGKRIEATEVLWNEGSNLLLTEIKKIVKL